MHSNAHKVVEISKNSEMKKYDPLPHPKCKPMKWIRSARVSDREPEAEWAQATEGEGRVGHPESVFLRISMETSQRVWIALIMVLARRKRFFAGFRLKMQSTYHFEVISDKKQQQIFQKV